MLPLRAAIMLCILASSAPAQIRPVRTMLHGNMTPAPPTEEYLKFVEEVRPDILIMGAFDQRLYSLAVPPPGKKKQSPDEILDRWRQAIARLHRSGIRVIGQMELNVVSDRPADLREKTGFIGYYENHWDAKRLGSRRTATAFELLEAPDLDDPSAGPQADANALCGCRVNTKALRGCLSKPAWREVQKRMVAAALAIGVDGFMTNRNFFGHCACSDCQTGFQGWLKKRHDAPTLKLRFGVADVSKIPCLIGEYRLIDSVPSELGLEKLRYAKQLVHDNFEEVYIRHARGLKKDAFAAQWNHMGFFDELHLDKGHLPPSTRTTFAHVAADERWSLPAERWGRGEDLIWYCNWGTTQNTILEKEYAGDTVLCGKLIREQAAGKAYVVNKYDFYRPRVMMAEAASLGYATNALATPWQHEEDRNVVLKYFSFLRKYEAVIHNAESHAEIGLIFPRRAVDAGNASAVEYVEAAGRSLVRGHFQFDLIPDDLISQKKLESYRAIIIAAPEYLYQVELDAVDRYRQSGGKVIHLAVAAEDLIRPGIAGSWPKPMSAFKASILVANARTNREGFIKNLLSAAGDLSSCEAPWTVECHVFRQAKENRLVVHLVNYNHREKAPGKSVSEREAPIAAEPVLVRVRVPNGFQASSIRFGSPDDDQEQALEFKMKDDFVEFRTPGFLVYGLCIVQGK